MIDEIKEIVGEDNYRDWVMLQPKVFYKNNKPYGLIAEIDGLVASTTKDPTLHFTIEMLQYLYAINAHKDITLITDNPDYFEHIKALLQPRGFKFTIKDNILFSRRKKWA